MMMMQCHPDKNPTAQEMAKLTSQRANEALEFLLNDDVRKQYDDWLEAHGRYNDGRGGMRIDKQLQKSLHFRCR